ncbi:hypothetical protein [Halotia branconii]|uniref:Uncharacterized protein n=1 Tax=Halotia branconii CENA392 TaxID=1539056 RepID=A0AAJ6PCQ7_9CYAN|nr:hypothetical protein [Halotia branconii]WGV29141.1 hypothetical protein QI031_30525 [Halotia branconii CENA392]
MREIILPIDSTISVEISFYDHEIYCGDKLIAAIAYDDDLTQPWVVLVEGVERFRANTWARCYRYISWHHQDGTLNAPLPFGEAELVTQHQQLALPPKKSELPTTTGNEVMSQIFTECEKYEFELLDDGIYHHDQKLGEVGCTDNHWWVIRASSMHQQKVPCDSVADAVWSLSMSQSVSCEDLLDRPFETLTPEEWRRLMEYEPAQKLVAA